MSRITVTTTPTKAPGDLTPAEIRALSPEQYKRAKAGIIASIAEDTRTHADELQASATKYIDDRNAAFAEEEARADLTRRRIRRAFGGA
jgi:hypothetical protein